MVTAHKTGAAVTQNRSDIVPGLAAPATDDKRGSFGDGDSVSFIVAEQHNYLTCLLTKLQPYGRE